MKKRKVYWTRSERSRVVELATIIHKRKGIESRDAIRFVARNELPDERKRFSFDWNGKDGDLLVMFDKMLADKRTQPEINFSLPDPAPPKDEKQTAMPPEWAVNLAERVIALEEQVAALEGTIANIEDRLFSRKSDRREAAIKLLAS